MELKGRYTEKKEKKSEVASALVHAALLGGLLILSSLYSPKTVKQNNADLKPNTINKSNPLQSDSLAKRNIKSEKQINF